MFKIYPIDYPFTPTELTQAAKRFEWMTGFLIIQFKFVHQILGMMVKIPKRGLNTMGVRVTPEGKFELYYDPIWSKNLSDEELTYIFYHEILHLALHHCTKRSLSKDKAEKHLANIAHDLAVNELIPGTYNCKRPVGEDGKVCGTFVSELIKMDEYKDIQEKQTAEWYWDYLRKKKKENEDKLPGIEPEGCDGNCTNCSLKEEGESKKGESNKEGPTCKQMDDHGGWSEHEVADEKVSAKIKEIDRMGDKSWGVVSQGVREIILAAQIKKINWRSKIRVWFGNHSWKDRITTRKRPNRRTGFIHPGFKKSYVDKYLVAADTSGSIDQELLSEWIGVINQLVEYLPIDFMQFDCSKQTDPKPYDRRRLKLEFKGRGGTNFQPVMDLVKERNYKGVMILTDGEASAPTQPKARVLWVLPIGCKPPVEWGDRVYLVKHV